MARASASIERVPFIFQLPTMYGRWGMIECEPVLAVEKVAGR